MEYMILACLLAFWAICGIISYGINFAYQNFEYPLIARMKLKNSRNFSLLMSLFGPFSLMTILLLGDYKHGFLYRTPYDLFRYVDYQVDDFHNGNRKTLNNIAEGFKR